MRLHISQTTLLFNEYLVINFSLRPSYRRIVELTAERCVRRDGDRPDVGREVVADDAAKKHETAPDAVADDVSDSRVIGSRDHALAPRDAPNCHRFLVSRIVRPSPCPAVVEPAHQHCSLGMAVLCGILCGPYEFQSMKLLLGKHELAYVNVRS